MQSAFYVIGGSDYGPVSLKTIGRLDPTHTTWTNSGELKYARRGHNAVFDGTHIIIVGGYNVNYKSENCFVSDATVTCTTQEPSLSRYEYYPELYLVSDSFCED